MSNQKSEEIKFRSQHGLKPLLEQPELKEKIERNDFARSLENHSKELPQMKIDMRELSRQLKKEIEIARRVQKHPQIEMEW